MIQVGVLRFWKNPGMGVLRSRTFYKIMKPLDMDGFEKIVTMNEKSDLSKAKKI
jgi:hypothetical protein